MAFTFLIEMYTDTRKTEFLLNNAVSPKGYAWAREEVRKLGLDPDSIPHDAPKAPRRP